MCAPVVNIEAEKMFEKHWEQINSVKYICNVCCQNVISCTVRSGLKRVM